MDYFKYYLESPERCKIIIFLISIHVFGSREAQQQEVKNMHPGIF